MKVLGQPMIVVLALLVGGMWHISHAVAPILFHSVAIESHPKGGGYAHKTVRHDGTITGGHLSGPPDAVRVYESNAEMTRDDMAKLNALVSEVHYKLPKGGADHPDQKAAGYLTVRILLYNDSKITFHAALRGEQTRFEHPEVQAIWELVYKYNVGAW
jgi:hypothetical protein